MTVWGKVAPRLHGHPTVHKPYILLATLSNSASDKKSRLVCAAALLPTTRRLFRPFRPPLPLVKSYVLSPWPPCQNKFVVSATMSTSASDKRWSLQHSRSNSPNKSVLQATASISAQAKSCVLSGHRPIVRTGLFFKRLLRICLGKKAATRLHVRPHFSESVGAFGHYVTPISATASHKESSFAFKASLLLRTS